MDFICQFTHFCSLYINWLWNRNWWMTGVREVVAVVPFNSFAWRRTHCCKVWSFASSLEYPLTLIAIGIIILMASGTLAKSRATLFSRGTFLATSCERIATMCLQGKSANDARMMKLNKNCGQKLQRMIGCAWLWAYATLTQFGKYPHYDISKWPQQHRKEN